MNIFIKDFIIFQNFPIDIKIEKNYNKITFGSNVILFYKEANNFSFNEIHFKEKYIEICWSNSFYPIFKYNGENCLIITPNYEHFFKFKLPLTINQNSIIEFILFNTIIGNDTFHNEVERIFYINKIYINDNKIKCERYNKQSDAKSLIEVFQNQVRKTIANTLSLKHGVLLSGGGESRINAAIAHFYGLQKEFITWGHPEDKEYKIAAKISNKLKTRHVNIRLEASCLPYKEFLLKTGFLVNMQYAYRYTGVKRLFKTYEYDMVWTGWGDINGYPTIYQPSELFSGFYLSLYKDEIIFPKGWNLDWLQSYPFEKNSIIKKIKNDNSKKTFFELKREIFTPYIFGQVISIENTLGSIYAPWFHPIIYQAVKREESFNSKIIDSKKERTIWKNELYYQLINKYFPTLNNIKNSKGYYPWMVRKQTGIFGLSLGYFLKILEKYKQYPFDPVEDRNFLKMELHKILDDSLEIFKKEDIAQFIKNIDLWNGYQILEIFKLIQVYWFLILCGK